MLPQLVQHLQLTGAAATVLVPHWPAQPWYAPLVALAASVLQLPAVGPPLLLTPFVPFPECQRWHMTAVRIARTSMPPPPGV